MINIKSNMEKIIDFFENIFVAFQKNAIRNYLVLANVLLVVFLIVFSNTGMLPFRTMGDFAFFVVLGFALAIYRPGWAFLFFIGSLALENINLAPVSLGIAIRPFQFLGAISLIAMAVSFFSKRVVYEKVKWSFADVLVVVFVFAGFLSALGSLNKGISFKQAIVATSFAALYFLVRIFIQSFDDAKRILPFFLSSGLVVALYGIWQNWRFIHGGAAFEVMPGRPNGTFTEADWYGIFLVFLLVIVYTIVYAYGVKITKRQETITKQISNTNIQNYNLKFGDWIFFVSCILCLVSLYTVLILTVSRSAWIGAVLVTLGFLKMILIYGGDDAVDGNVGFWKGIIFAIRKSWDWKRFGKQFGILAIVFGLSLAIVYGFGLTNFQLGNRAVSTGGLQKITIACPSDTKCLIPKQINSLADLDNCNCRHINLEDIEKEKTAGNYISEVYRPDPNVNIRSEIYRKSIAQIKMHPILGIGWGSISQILGTDERGAGLNASNLFLEAWLGAGLLGIISIIVLFGYVLVLGYVRFVKAMGNDIAALFLLLGWFAIVIPNLFNSGIFLAFVWVYLAIAVSLLKSK